MINAMGVAECGGTYTFDHSASRTSSAEFTESVLWQFAEFDHQDVTSFARAPTTCATLCIMAFLYISLAKRDNARSAFTAAYALLGHDMTMVSAHHHPGKYPELERDTVTTQVSAYREALAF